MRVYVPNSDFWWPPEDDFFVSETEIDVSRVIGIARPDPLHSERIAPEVAERVGLPTGHTALVLLILDGFEGNHMPVMVRSFEDAIAIWRASS